MTKSAVITLDGATAGVERGACSPVSLAPYQYNLRLTASAGSLTMGGLREVELRALYHALGVALEVVGVIPRAALDDE